MKRCFIAVVTFLALGSPSWANDMLAISGQNLPTWDPSSQPSPTFTVGIQNLSDTDLLIAWQVELEIVPVGAASGLSFASVSMPTSNYSLGSNSDGFVGTINNPTSLVAFDTAYNEGPVSVPASGDNLLSATFSAAPGAQGTFNIVAIPDALTGSYWYSSDVGETNFNQYAFSNVPFGTNDPPVVIGVVSLGVAATVPEPQSAVLLASAVVVLLVFCARRAAFGR